MRSAKHTVWAILNQHGITSQPTGPWVFEYESHIHITGKLDRCQEALKAAKIVHEREPDIISISKRDALTVLQPA
jgi:hypothetical protein